MRVLAGRRPEVMLLAALLVFGLVAVLRGLQARPAAPLAVNMAAPAPAPVERSDERMGEGASRRGGVALRVACVAGCG